MVETDGLENRYVGNGIGGSNPPASAKIQNSNFCKKYSQISSNKLRRLKLRDLKGLLCVGEKFGLTFCFFGVEFCLVNKGIKGEKMEEKWCFRAYIKSGDLNPENKAPIEEDNFSSLEECRLSFKESVNVPKIKTLFRQVFDSVQ